MKWTEREEIEYGTLRVVSRFLLFPKSIGKETRWLQFVKIEQKYVNNDLWTWEDIRFID